MTKPTLEQLCRGLEEVYTPAITEIMEEYGLMNQWLGKEIAPLDRNMKVAGPAFTMRWVNDPVPLGEEGKRYIGGINDALEPFMVPVIDSGKAPDSGYWGELMCNLCLKIGITGAVIDGGVRDPDYIYKLGRFNMFATFICPHEANKRSQLESFQKPIFINGVKIRPGDFIVAEVNGVIVIPQEIVYEVYDKTRKIVEMESETRKMINQGVSIDKIIEMGYNL